MKEVFVKICERHIAYWHQLRDGQAMKNLPIETAEELLQVFQQHNKSFESICTYCSESVAYLVRQVYQAYERDAPNPILKSVVASHVEQVKDIQIEKPTVPKDEPQSAVSSAAEESSEIVEDKIRESHQNMIGRNVIHVKQGARGKSLKNNPNRVIKGRSNK
jgi:hypothetical protein